jgi:hypothetical protein
VAPQNLELFWDLPKDERQLLEQLEQGHLNRLFDSVFKFVVCKNEESPIINLVLDAAFRSGMTRAVKS